MSTFPKRFVELSLDDVAFAFSLVDFKFAKFHRSFQGLRIDFSLRFFELKVSVSARCAAQRYWANLSNHTTATASVSFVVGSVRTTKSGSLCSGGSRISCKRHHLFVFFVSSLLVGVRMSGVQIAWSTRSTKKIRRKPAPVLFYGRRMDACFSTWYDVDDSKRRHQLAEFS